MLVGSSYVYKATSEQLVSSESKLKSKKVELVKVSALYDDVNRGISSVDIKEPSKIEPVLDLYTKFGYDLKAKTSEFGVNIAFVKVSGYAGADTDISALPQVFSGAKHLKSMTMSLNGKYRTYDGFKQFLNWISERPISISNISVNGDTFDLVVDLYGE